MSRRILVTGSTGNLGAYMVRLLLRDGHRVVAPVRSRTRAGLNRVLRSLRTFDDSLGHLSEAEQADVMRRFHITQLGEFPEISRFDPVATAIGLRPGQVCEIIRPSKTAITGLYYRVCV